MNLIFFGQCRLKVSVRELAHLKHSRHAHACGSYLLGETQVRDPDILTFSRWEPGPHPGGKDQALAQVVRPRWELQIFWSCENRKCSKVFLWTRLSRCWLWLEAIMWGTSWKAQRWLIVQALVIMMLYDVTVDWAATLLFDQYFNL